MKVTLELDITDCRDCNFRKSHYGHGECWDYCTHKQAPEFPTCILWGCQASFSKVPKWCPLGLDERKVK